MAYCTQEDVARLLPEAEMAALTSEDGEAVDATVVEECIAKADAEIDGYLGVRYQTPLSPTPEVVKAIAVELAIYNIYKRRGRLEMPETVRNGYLDRISFLKLVMDGRATVGATAAPPSSVSQNVAAISSNTPAFTRDSLKGL